MRPAIEATGTRLAFVHMVDEQVARPMFERHGLDDLPRLSDPGRRLYASVGLGRGSVRELFGWRVWRRFLGGAWRHGVGPLAGDGFQMPGACLVANGRVVRVYRSKHVADAPNYMDLSRRVPRSVA